MSGKLKFVTRCPTNFSLSLGAAVDSSAYDKLKFVGQRKLKFVGQQARLSQSLAVSSQNTAILT